MEQVTGAVGAEVGAEEGAEEGTEEGFETGVGSMGMKVGAGAAHSPRIIPSSPNAGQSSSYLSLQKTSLQEVQKVTALGPSRMGMQFGPLQHSQKQTLEPGGVGIMKGGG